MKIKLENKTIEVSKLPLGKYAELLKALEELPKVLADMGDIDNDKLIKLLPSIIAKSLPDFVRMICIATPLEEDEVNLISLDEAVDIVLAVVKVNNYQGIFDKVKNLKAQTPETKTT